MAHHEEFRCIARNTLASHAFRAVRPISNFLIGSGAVPWLIEIILTSSGGGYVSLKPVVVKPLLAFATDRPCKDVAAFGRPRHRDRQVLHVWMTIRPSLSPFT
jgi:hypothetical protein